MEQYKALPRDGTSSCPIDGTDTRIANFKMLQGFFQLEFTGNDVRLATHFQDGDYYGSATGCAVFSNCVA
ncbi:hypothetical protein GN244_ATG04439 [Phytophthora infestans]|uniref:Uncharacterized protein n=1 Tax=Phytophthora infestans TaxID=4787 RepID=A0A833SMQ0_PHYIN|nr:hypothetical protein GN244_ATG04439 [Phytophthora infestans]